MMIPFDGRWEKQLKRASDNFLNYVNARVMPQGVMFIFTFRELERIELEYTKITGTEEDKIEKVIRKISKMLALSDLEHNPEEKEAISVSMAVQKLLAKYNLSLADIKGHRPEEEIEQVIADVSISRKWKYGLADVVAENYACKCFYCGADEIVFFGYKADILIARRVFIYLIKVGNRLANQYVKRYKEKNGESDNVYNSFVSGFIDGVRKELEKQCTALALVVQPEVTNAYDAFTADFKTINPKIQADRAKAYREGIEEGKRALNAQYVEDFTMV